MIHNVKFQHHRNRGGDFVDHLASAVKAAMELRQIKSYGHRSWSKGWTPQAVCNSDNFTICTIVDDDGNILGVGYAFCSQKDQFSRKVGRRISENRAMYNAAPRISEIQHKQAIALVNAMADEPK